LIGRRPLGGGSALEGTMNRKMLLGDPPAARVARNDFGRREGGPAGASNASSSAAFLRRETAQAAAPAEADAAPSAGPEAGAPSEEEPGEPRTDMVGLPPGLAGLPDRIFVLPTSPGT